MCYDPITVDSIRRTALLESWHSLVERGGLNVRGLLHLRWQLSAEAREFLPDTDVTDLALAVDAALAAELDCLIEDLPGRSGLGHVPADWL